MITVADDRRRRRGRVLEIALALSIAVHLLLVFVYFGLAGLFARLLPAPPKPKQDQIVEITNAIRIEKRPKLRPVAPPKPQVQQRQAIASAPAPERVVAPPEVPVPVVRPELAKPAPTAPPQPTPLPTLPPTAPPRVAQKIARAQTPTTQEHAAAAERPSHSSQLSQAQLAAIERDLAHTIAQARSDENPLRVPDNDQPAGPKQYQVQMRGALRNLRGYQGLCDPIKDWVADGYDWYYVSCRVAFTDGMVQVQPVPWPVRFRPNADPFTGTLQQVESPLAPPLPGWKLAPGQHISKELLEYARKLGADI